MTFSLFIKINHFVRCCRRAEWVFNQFKAGYSLDPRREEKVVKCTFNSKVYSYSFKDPLNIFEMKKNYKWKS